MPAICGAVELKASLIVVARREAPRRNRSLAFAIEAPVAGDPDRRGAQPRRSDAFTIGKYGLGTLLLLGKLMAAFYVTCLFFVVPGGPRERPAHVGATSSSIACMIEGTPAIAITLPIQKPGAPDTLLRMRSAPMGMRVRRRRASFISAPVVFTYSNRMASARGSVSIGTPNAFATLRPNSVPVYSG